MVCHSNSILIADRYGDNANVLKYLADNPGINGAFVVEGGTLGRSAGYGGWVAGWGWSWSVDLLSLPQRWSVICSEMCVRRDTV